MKIVFIVNSAFPNYSGGIENWLFNVAGNLSFEHEISIFSLDNSTYPNFYPSLPNNIKLHRVKTLKSIKMLRPFVRGYINLLDLHIGMCLLRRCFKKINKDFDEYFIIALDSMYCINVGLAGKEKGKNVKLISSVRGPHAEIRGNRFPIFAKYFLRFEKQMLKKVDQIWANGHDTLVQLANKGFDAKLMKNGINFDKLSRIKLEDDAFVNIVKSKQTVITVGTLLPIKGIKELIDAGAILKSQGLEIQLVFVGKGNPEVYKKYANEQGLYQQVFFLGHQENPIRFVKECSVVACLSGGSGMSMAAIESMASGVPVIAWDTPVYKQFNCESETMLLVENLNPIALANGIKEIINNRDAFALKSSQAVNESKKYDWQYVCEDLINYLDRL